MLCRHALRTVGDETPQASAEDSASAAYLSKTQMLRDLGFLGSDTADAALAQQSEPQQTAAAATSNGEASDALSASAEPARAKPKAAAKTAEERYGLNTFSTAALPLF